MSTRTGKFELFKSEKNSQYYFRLKASNGEVIASSEGYTSKASALNGIESIRHHAAQARLVDLTESS